MIVFETNIFTTSGGLVSFANSVDRIDACAHHQHVQIPSMKPHKHQNVFKSGGENKTLLQGVFLAAHSSTRAHFKPSISFAPTLTLDTAALATAKRVCFTHNTSISAS